MIEIINVNTDEEAKHPTDQKEVVVNEIMRLMKETFMAEGEPGDEIFMAFVGITRDDGVPGVACYLTGEDEISDDDEGLQFLVFGMTQEEWIMHSPIAGDAVRH